MTTPPDTANKCVYPSTEWTLQEFANRVCRDLPKGYMLTLEMENGAAWFELYDEDGERIEIDDIDDRSVLEQGIQALMQACGASAIRHQEAKSND